MKPGKTVLLGAALLALLLTPSGSWAASPKARTVSGAANTARFWTAARMREALPRTHSASPAAARSIDASPAGEPLRVQGRPPSRRYRRGAVVADASSLRIGDSSAVEERTNGRIFGVDPREGLYSCSGTAIDTPSGSIVLTAGHCVVEERSWGRHIIFIPAYDHRQRPFGTFVAEAVYVPPRWRRSENPDFDVAALRVAPNRLGTLTSVVGARGYETGRSRFSSFQIFGYPAAAAEGQELRSCQTHGLGSDSLTNFFEGPPTVPSKCDMASGSSGGAWITDGKYVNGVTSYGYTNASSRLYSPYFGVEIGNFLSHLP